MDWDSRNALGTEPAMKTLTEIRNIGSMEELNDFITDPDATFGVGTLLNASISVSLNDSENILFRSNRTI